ncbi:39S ribosomal protein L46, mitochondrial isoform X1 [Cricetulus griseus]|uniref:Large ribosomal subunit protein mL46 n=1 Tax=Cricetulus griseus TaxID=10029 RepID=A0A9J7JLB9_CRIGR|nr:39S ribosomal protein L46, mitochondrial isoform X1 [Cricetulus griseus]XP_027263973.1 39S ribosomal protein L46, mitochondrial isoform X2 [Cricetulus griseus]
MAAPVGRTLLGATRGWRRLDSLWAGSPRSRGLSLEAAPSGSRSPWRLWGALCLQRPPLITKPLTPLQQEMADLLQKVETERSLYSDHELRALEEAKQLAKKKADLYDDGQDEQGVTLVQDLEDIWEQAFLQFKPGARVTEADKKNDRTSLNRKLDRNLVLLVREKLGDQELWMLPQVQWQPGETLRGTAERILATLSENSMEAKFLGNAPCGHYKFKLPKAIRTESDIGVKVFFFKALLLTGDVPQTGKKSHHVWASKEELGDYLQPKYLAQVRRFLLDF